MNHDFSDVDTSILKKALAQLEDALRFVRSFPVNDGEGIAIHLRAGAIQAFEFTYEISMATIKRYIKHFFDFEEHSMQHSFNDIIRMAYKVGVIQKELLVWQRFRRLRNLTSHTYDEPTAEEVISSLPEFISEIRDVIGNIDDQKSR